MPAMYSMDAHAGKPVIQALGVGRPCCRQNCRFTSEIERPFFALGRRGEKH